MQAYANDGRLMAESPLRRCSAPLVAATRAGDVGVFQSPLVDQLLGRLADLIVDRLTERGEVGGPPQPDEWLDTRAAAAHLGLHRDTIRKLAAERSIPSHQDGPGCKLYFRRDELDAWRRSTKPTGRVSPTTLRAVP